MTHPIRRRWIWSIILIVVTILVIMLVFNNIAINVLDEEIVKAQTTAMDFLSQGVDRRLLELENVSIQLEINNQNIHLRHTDDSESFTSEKTYEYIELMRNAKLANEYIDDIFIYYPKYDYVVGSRGSFTSRGYFLLSNGLIDTHYEEWLRFIMQENSSNFVVDDGVYKEPVLFYRHQMLTERGGNSGDAIIVAQISRDAVTNFSRIAVENQPYSSLAILDSNRNIYTGSTQGDIDMAIAVLKETYPDNSAAESTFSWDGYNAMFVQSVHSGLFYLVVNSMDAILSVPNSISAFSYLMIAICLLIGVIMSVIVSKRHSKPIEELAVRLFDNIPQPANQMDYDYIERQVDRILRENTQAIQRNVEQSWKLKDRFINEIISSAQESATTINSMTSYFGLCFDYIQFRLVTVCFSETDALPAGDIIRQCARDAAEQAEKKTEIFVVPALVRNNLVFLLNYETFDNVWIQDLTAHIQTITSGEVGVALSDEFQTESGVLFAYEQALSRLDACTTLADGGNKASIARIYKEWEKERIIYAKWRKCLHLKEYSQAADMCAELFAKYVFGQADAYSLRARKYAVLNSLLEMIDEESLRHGTLSRKDAVALLQSHSEMDKLADCVKTLLLQMDNANSTYVDTLQDTLTYKIKQIIDENYTHSYLGLYYIADIVKVSSSYVSKIFKREYGIGVTEYINQLRVMRAKELIAERSLNIKEVAEQVGFNSDIHFIRVFKKYENTTPGSYRKIDK